MSDSNKALKEKLLSSRKNGFDRVDAAELEQMEAYCKEYMTFLDAGKTERLCAAETVRLAEQAGYKPLVRGQALKAGDKVYVCNRGKSVLLAHIGSKPMSEGAQIAAAHIDSPRLDLKPNPLYEDNELAYFKTHHYGGFRKYQWVTVPLELHGKIVRADGSEVYVKIGADPEDPQFVINDLLPHLGREQGKKPLNEAIPSESLNILIGSWPEPDDDGSDRVKLAIMRILHEKYGIVEEDFISAELEAVPAANARDLGFDRSLIGAYGHDDRVCAYAELAAILQLDVPEKTAVCIFADKEEIGSEGVSGMQSEAFEHFMKTLCGMQSASPPTLLPLTTPTSPRSMSAATRPMSTTAWACASTPAPAARAARPTRLPRSWAASAGCSTATASCGRWPSLARPTQAAAERSQSTWPSATSTRSTRASPCFPCTRRMRRSRSSTAT